MTQAPNLSERIHMPSWRAGARFALSQLTTASASVAFLTEDMHEAAIRVAVRACESERDRLATGCQPGETSVLSERVNEAISALEKARSGSADERDRALEGALVAVAMLQAVLNGYEIPSDESPASLPQSI